MSLNLPPGETFQDFANRKLAAALNEHHTLKRRRRNSITDSPLQRQQQQQQQTSQQVSLLHSPPTSSSSTTPAQRQTKQLQQALSIDEASASPVRLAANLKKGKLRSPLRDNHDSSISSTGYKECHTTDGGLYLPKPTTSTTEKDAAEVGSSINRQPQQQQQQQQQHLSSMGSTNVIRTTREVQERELEKLVQESMDVIADTPSDLDTALTLFPGLQEHADFYRELQQQQQKQEGRGRSETEQLVEKREKEMKKQKVVKKEKQEEMDNMDSIRQLDNLKGKEKMNNAAEDEERQYIKKEQLDENEGDSEKKLVKDEEQQILEKEKQAEIMQDKEQQWDERQDVEEPPHDEERENEQQSQSPYIELEYSFHYRRQRVTYSYQQQSHQQEQHHPQEQNHNPQEQNYQHEQHYQQHQSCRPVESYAEQQYPIQQQQQQQYHHYPQTNLPQNPQGNHNRSHIQPHQPPPNEDRRKRQKTSHSRNLTSTSNNLETEQPNQHHHPSYHHHLPNFQNQSPSAPLHPTRRRPPLPPADNTTLSSISPIQFLNTLPTPYATLLAYGYLSNWSVHTIHSAMHHAVSYYNSRLSSSSIDNLDIGNPPGIQEIEIWFARVRRVDGVEEEVLNWFTEVADVDEGLMGWLKGRGFGGAF